MNKIYKAEYGYIKHQKKIEIIKTTLMLFLCIAVYLIGYLSTGSNKNLLTFVAVLGVLPMARSAVSAVLFTKATGCSAELHDELVAKKLPVTFYDLYMTTYKVCFQFSAATYKRDCFVLLTEDPKMDVAAAEEHVREVFKNAGNTTATIKVFTDKDKFINRLSELALMEDDGKDNEFLFDNIVNVSI